jgi:hypothetical protein
MATGPTQSERVYTDGRRIERHPQGQKLSRKANSGQAAEP